MANISIEFNFDNGNPTWKVEPESLRVPPGNSPVNWNLSGAGATFPTTNGIVFPAPGAGSKNALAWPGTTPSFQNTNKYTADDHNTLVKGDASQTFRYNITVLFNNQTFSHDPDVTNDPPAGGGGPTEDPEDVPPSPSN